MVSDQQLIEDLKGFADELGKTPTKREMSSKGPWSGATYRKYFGSWNNALQKAGLEINYKVSKERFISDLKEFSEKLGKTPSAKEMKESGPWSPDAYENKFGSWNDALKKAGLEPNHEINISKERLISDLQRLANELGRTPSKNEMIEKGPWSDGVYYNHFGSWNNAIKQAGLKINREIDFSQSKDQLIKDLQNFSNEIGETPSRRQMRNKGPWDHLTYRYNFGSWNNALQKAGLEINCLGRDERAGTGENYFGENWYEQRRKVVKRSGGKCRICGDDELANVHHIKPRREFDDVSNSNTLDNLITLCPSHHGRLEGKWQDATPDEFEEKAKELIQ